MKDVGSTENLMVLDAALTNTKWFGFLRKASKATVKVATLVGTGGMMDFVKEVRKIERADFSRRTFRFSSYQMFEQKSALCNDLYVSLRKPKKLKIDPHD
jgi:hypothetical protein